ncbi:MAG: winged helix-turn-helix domain-containing protein, partial [Victivallaceae bacterium]|nr:winged helix-turn-helix domain-containing protein [Victivallaceae bacterium]
MNITIDKNNIKPAYLQLKDAIAGAIRKGELAVGSKILSENALSKKYGIHRHTTRNSLQLLSEEGLITSIPGRGWFVTADMDKSPDASIRSEKKLSVASAKKVVGVIYGAPS